MKKTSILLIVFISIFIIGVATYIGITKKNVTNIDKNKQANEYECRFIEEKNDELNTFKTNHSYDITLENNKVIKSVEYINYYFNTYEDFYRIYSKYNSDQNDNYKIIGFDFDNNFLSISKEEAPNITFSEYKENNKIKDKYCSKKTSNNKKEKKVNKYDKTYICKYNDLVSYLTVDKNNLITSAMNGTMHKIETIEEYNNFKKVLKDSDVLKYFYDDNTLTITQLNKMFIYDDMYYSDYINNSLTNYHCELKK